MDAGFYLGLKFWGGGSRLSITANDCRARYTHKFGACIVCI